MNKILIIGCGHMGGALLDSWYKKKIFNISAIDPKTYKFLKKKYPKKLYVYKSLDEINNISKFNVIIFAVKPQIAHNVLSKFNFKYNKKTLFISIVAGKKINFFKKYLFKSSQIIRAMPNMPALIGEGMTALTSNKYTSKKNKLIANNLFKSVGEIIWVSKEIEIDKITAISGSGPGYFFLFIEHLISESIKIGFKKEVAVKIVQQTAYGSIKLLYEGKKSANELRRNIAILGGTTEAAINTFENKKQLKKIIGKAVNAAYSRAKTLGKK